MPYTKNNKLITRLILALSTFCFSCNPTTNRTDNKSTTENDTNPTASQVWEVKNEFANSVTRLKDSTFIRGNFVLFLVPDSLRFEHYSKEQNSGIYDADSDFGFGISATIDSFSQNKKYQNIEIAISDKRYILIEDGKNGPLTFDRDTINHGIIMTSKGKDFKINTFLHSGDYLDDVDEYFVIKRGDRP